MKTAGLDNIHRQLNDLSAKRAAGIAEVGTEYTLKGTERTFRAVTDPEGKSAMFEAGAPLQLGQLWGAKNGGTFCILTAPLSFPGCVVAEVAGVVGTAQVQKKGSTHGASGPVTVLNPTPQTVPILKHDGSAVTVPLRLAGLNGSVLKTASALLEVKHVRIDGPVAVLLTVPYTPPAQKSITRKQPRPEWVTNQYRQPDGWHSSNV